MKQHFIWELAQSDWFRRRGKACFARNRCPRQAQRRRSKNQITAWIDTAFDGHLVFSKSLIESLNLELLAEAEAILADGSKMVLETFLCYLDWFGQLLPLQVIANEGRFPLLGTGLLAQRVLRIDYTRIHSLQIEANDLIQNHSGDPITSGIGPSPL